MDNANNSIERTFKGFVCMFFNREKATAPIPKPAINAEITRVEAATVAPPVSDNILNQLTSKTKKQEPAINAIVAKKSFCLFICYYLAG